MRWGVGTPELDSPVPRFFEAGSVHTVDNTHADSEMRDIVFELVQPGSTGRRAEEVAAREVAAQHNTPVLQTKPGEGHIAAGFAVFKLIKSGDLTPGYAVHKLTNLSPESWLVCYQVELK